jgi:lysophospholipase L1-like esterase
MKRIFLLFALLLSACTQEIPADFPTDFPTFAYPAETATVEPSAAPTETMPAPATMEPAAPLPTPTLVTFPPPAPLPNVPLSMIAIGDGLTLGEGDNTFRGYPGRLLELVSQVRPGSTMTNFGQAGWDSGTVIRGAQGLFGQLSRAVSEVNAAVSQGRGAVVFVWVGSTDLWNLYESDGDVSREQEERDVQNFSDNLNIILYELRNAGAEVIVALLDDQSRRPAATRGDVFPGITPDEAARMSAQVQRYNAVILQKAEQYGALTVDFYSTDIFVSPATLSNDGYHPNRIGYDLIAQEWYDVLSLLFD